MATNAPTRDQLIESLQEAFRLKGKTPTGPDAEKRRYGLWQKQRYVTEFGTWNDGIRAAKLPVNEWRRPAMAILAHNPPPAEVVDLEAVIVERIKRHQRSLEAEKAALAAYRGHRSA